MNDEAISIEPQLPTSTYQPVTSAGNEESGHWLCVTDERFGIDYEIDSHADYWDFIGYFSDGKQWPVKPVPVMA